MDTRVRDLTGKSRKGWGGAERSGPSPDDRERVCAFRLDQSAPRNRLSRGTAIEGLFHPDRRFPSDGQDQSRPEGAVGDSD